MTKECTECKKNGHTGIMVNWTLLGTDSTGKKTWEAHNLDGSLHNHMVKAGTGGNTIVQGQDWKERSDQIKQAHDENMAESKLLRTSIDKLTEAINNAGAKLGVIGYAALDKKDTEEGPEEEEEGPTE